MRFQEGKLRQSCHCLTETALYMLCVSGMLGSVVCLIMKPTWPWHGVNIVSLNSIIHEFRRLSIISPSSILVHEVNVTMKLTCNIIGHFGWSFRFVHLQRAYRDSLTIFGSCPVFIAMVINKFCWLLKTSWSSRLFKHYQLRLAIPFSMQ